MNLRARALGVCMSLTLCLVTEKLEKSLVGVCLRIKNNLQTALFVVKHSLNYSFKIFVASNHMLTLNVIYLSCTIRMKSQKRMF